MQQEDMMEVIATKERIAEHLFDPETNTYYALIGDNVVLVSVMDDDKWDHAIFSIIEGHRDSVVPETAIPVRKSPVKDEDTLVMKGYHNLIRALGIRV
jgi:hypothetical protein